MRAFDDNALLQRRLGHSAYTGGPLEVHILRLDTSDAAELLVSLPERQWGVLEDAETCSLLPFRYQTACQLLLFRMTR